MSKRVTIFVLLLAAATANGFMPEAARAQTQRYRAPTGARQLRSYRLGRAAATARPARATRPASAAEKPVPQKLVERRAARPTERQSQLIRWPSAREYLTAIQQPENLNGLLRRGVLEMDEKRGLPVTRTGSFSSVYRFRFEDGSKFAVRVSHPPEGATDRADVQQWRERYQRLIKYFERVDAPPEIVQIRWLDDGVVVDGTSYPVTVMPWIEARSLDRWFADTVKEADGATKIGSFANEFRAFIADLRKAKIAHGDLQHNNILIENETNATRVIDYDAMWTPTLADLGSSELGHRNYHHPGYWKPKKQNRPYGPDLDHFSSLVIYLTARAVERQPELWERFHEDKALLLTSDDYENPGASPVLAALKASPDAVVQNLATALEAYCKMDPSKVPPLEKVISDAEAGKPPSQWNGRK